MDTLEILAAFVIGFGAAVVVTRTLMRTSARTDRLADPSPFAAELYGPVVEVEVSHPFRSSPDLTTFPNMALACSFLAETFTAGGFSQIVLTAIDDPETPADLPDWWEAERSAVERAIEEDIVTRPNEYATRAHAYSPGFSGMVCDAMVERDGFGDSCGLPADHPVHVETEKEQGR